MNSERTGSKLRWVGISVGVCLAFVLAACATARPPDVTTPRPAENVYPIVVNEDLARRETAMAAWRNLMKNQQIVDQANPDLYPVTSTLQRLPVLPGNGLTLPPIGKKPEMSEEETRESLRRFLAATGPLICADQSQLTLVKRNDDPDGTKSALYEQRPFRYSLRGGFGQVLIQFTDGRQVRQLSSTCLPDLDDTQRDLQSLRPDPTITPDKLATTLLGKTFTAPGGSGPSVTIANKDDFTLGEPIILVRRTDSSPSALEFRLAWEVMLKAGFPVYVDAIDGTVLPAPPVVN
ncbi:MAG: hypothetical protein ABIP75_03375 [Pyrinomonadaceae bacterium]